MVVDQDADALLVVRAGREKMSFAQEAVQRNSNLLAQGAFERAIATGEDFRFPQVAGRRPPGHALISSYMARAHRAANRDPVVLKRFFEVASLLAPPTAMMSPSIAWRVLLGGLGAPQSDPSARLRAETAVVA